MSLARKRRGITHELWDGMGEKMGGNRVEWMKLGKRIEQGDNLSFSRVSH